MRIITGHTVSSALFRNALCPPEEPLCVRESQERRVLVIVMWHPAYCDDGVELSGSKLSAKQKSPKMSTVLALPLARPRSSELRRCFEIVIDANRGAVFVGASCSSFCLTERRRSTRFLESACLRLFPPFTCPRPYIFLLIPPCSFPPKYHT